MTSWSATLPLARAPLQRQARPDDLPRMNRLPERGYGPCNRAQELDGLLTTCPRPQLLEQLRTKLGERCRRPNQVGRDRARERGGQWIGHLWAITLGWRTSSAKASAPAGGAVDTVLIHETIQRPPAEVDASRLGARRHRRRCPGVSSRGDAPQAGASSRQPTSDTLMIGPPHDERLSRSTVCPRTGHSRRWSCGITQRATDFPQGDCSPLQARSLRADLATVLLASISSSVGATGPGPRAFCARRVRMRQGVSALSPLLAAPSPSRFPRSGRSTTRSRPRPR